MSTNVRSTIPMENKYDRVILLIDMDCFYCQVEEKLNPTLKGKPLAVVQYNAWRGGGIIAVNYAARAKGVTRHMRGDEAKEQCPEIVLVKVPNIREKADLSKYRNAGKNVAYVLQSFTKLLERASVDEAYLDITETVNERLDNITNGSDTVLSYELKNTYAVGYEHISEYVSTITAQVVNSYDNDNTQWTFNESEVSLKQQHRSEIALLIGASIANEIRCVVRGSTGYECSAGIAHNKILAKLACGMNKPNKQTILSMSQVPILFETTPVGKIKGLGAKFGEEVCERLNVRFLGEMLKYTESDLQRKFDEKNGTWLYNICRGIDLEAVIPRFYTKSIGCCKKFPGRNNITGIKSLQHWLNELATEISDRLEKDIIENNRKARQIVVSYIQEINGVEVSSSRITPLKGYDTESIAKQSFEVIKKNTVNFLRAGSDTVLNNPLKFLGISVGKFETVTSGKNKLQEMFANQTAKKRTSDENKVGNEVIEVAEESSKAKDPVAADKQPEKENEKKSENVSLLSENSSENQTNSNTNNFAKGKFKSFFFNALLKQHVPQINGVECKTAEIEPKTDVSQQELKPKSAPTSINTVEDDNKNLRESEDLTVQDYNEDSASNNFGLSLNEISTFMTEPPPKKQKFTENADNPTVQQNYEENYAEFRIPELRSDSFDYIKCDKCGSNVVSEEFAIQAHQDYHFAQQLSQQQRDEFRADIKTKISAASKTKTIHAENKRTKGTTNNTKSTVKFTKTNIKKFLLPVKTPPITMPNPSSVSISPSQLSQQLCELVHCQECKALVRQSELQEHLDYHVAIRMSKELNAV